MSSYLCFQHFQPITRLDNFVSGIPNAIMADQWPPINKVRRDADPRSPSPGTPIEVVQVIAILMP
jgi:hypothetical protein